MFEYFFIGCFVIYFFKLNIYCDDLYLLLISRYYESCVAETKTKGTFGHGHLILTNDSLFVTQNPPKTMMHSIRLAKIQEINLVSFKFSSIYSQY